jgi:5-formyltetrahydrofolate cyclo-ligase
MAETTPGKPQLRTELRQRRNKLGAVRRETAAQRISQYAQTLPQWSSAQHIALYCNIGSEVATEDLAQACRTQGKSLYLPVLEDNGQLLFAEWTDTEPLPENHLGIGEPPSSARRCPVSDLDIIFLPLLGWDRSGGRLGMGGGYYDRTLEDISGPLLVGLAYSVQELKEIPRESWDITLDSVLTEAGIQMCPRGAARRSEQAISE